MSVRRVLVLLVKELLMGPKNMIFIFALVVPLVITLLINLLVGTFFSGKPRLGVADTGQSMLG
jgi:ABC-2 type transport system permease protein